MLSLAGTMHASVVLTALFFSAAVLCLDLPTAPVLLHITSEASTFTAPQQGHGPLSNRSGMVALHCPERLGTHGASALSMGKGPLAQSAAVPLAAHVPLPECLAEQHRGGCSLGRIPDRPEDGLQPPRFHHAKFTAWHRAFAAQTREVANRSLAQHLPPPHRSEEP